MNEQFKRRGILSERTLAKLAGTTSFNVASPSPSNVKAVRWGSAASNRIGDDSFLAAIGFSVAEKSSPPHFLPYKTCMISRTNCACLRSPM